MAQNNRKRNWQRSLSTGDLSTLEEWKPLDSGDGRIIKKDVDKEEKMTEIAEKKKEIDDDKECVLRDWIEIMNNEKLDSGDGMIIDDNELEEKKEKDSKGIKKVSEEMLQDEQKFAWFGPGVILARQKQESQGAISKNLYLRRPKEVLKEEEDKMGSDRIITEINKQISVLGKNEEYEETSDSEMETDDEESKRIMKKMDEDLARIRKYCNVVGEEKVEEDWDSEINKEKRIVAPNKEIDYNELRYREKKRVRIDLPKLSQWGSFEKKKRDENLPVKRSGVMFSDVILIPTDPNIDPPPYTCFNCWQRNHRTRDCPNKIQIHCDNCGRAGVDLSNCPRCSIPHKRYIEEKYRHEKEIEKELDRRNREELMRELEEEKERRERIRKMRERQEVIERGRQERERKERIERENEIRCREYAERMKREAILQERKERQREWMEEQERRERERRIREQAERAEREEEGKSKGGDNEKVQEGCKIREMRKLVESLKDLPIETQELVLKSVIKERKIK